MPKQTIAHYHQHAERFQAQYDSLRSENVHADWIHLLEGHGPGSALDVGAGSGRDAHWLAQQGWQVTAVEPAASLRDRGRCSTGSQVNWVDAELPGLAGIEPPANGYDLILLSAVWMHLPKEQRPTAFTRLSELLSQTGILIITLRYGPSDPARPMYPVSTDELVYLAALERLQVFILNETVTEDCLKRNDVSWQTVCIQRISEPQG